MSIGVTVTLGLTRQAILTPGDAIAGSVRLVTALKTRLHTIIDMPGGVPGAAVAPGGRSPSDNSLLPATGKAIQEVRQAIDHSLLPVIKGLDSPLASLVGRVAGLIDRFPVLGQAIGAVSVAQKSATIVSNAWVAAQKVQNTVTRTWAAVSLAAQAVSLRQTATLWVQTSAIWLQSTAIKTWAVVTRVWTAVSLAAQAAMWRLNAALLANPVGWVVAGIVGVVVALTFLVRNWESVWSKIKSVFVGIWDFITGKLQALVKSFEWLSGISGRFFGGGAPQGDAPKAGAVVKEAIPRKKPFFGRILGIEASQPGDAIKTRGESGPDNIAGELPRLPEAERPVSHHVTHGPTNITVHASAGMDEDSLAEAIMRKLQQARRSALTDGSGGLDMRADAL